jgi:CRISPR-associated protein Cas2
MLDDWSSRTPHPAPRITRHASRIMYLVISYDIKDDRRRLKIHKALKDYGTWVQYSVFECQITRKEFLLLRHRLKKLLGDDGDDSIRFYGLCEECKEKIERIGGVIPREGGTVIV